MIAARDAVDNRGMPSTIQSGLLDPRLWRSSAFRDGVRDMLKVTPAVCAWGLVTGVAMAKSGLSLIAVICMSGFVFAASAQLAAMPLMLAGAPLWVVWLTAICVNLRFVIFSAQMRRHMLALPLRWRLLAGYLTADMTFALMVKQYDDAPSASDGHVAPIAYFAGLSVVNWSSWNVASLAGVFLANSIPMSWGLELAGALALLGLLATLSNTAPKVLVAVVAAGVALATHEWPYRLGIVAAVVTAIAMGVVCDQWATRRRT